ncbi:MAG: ABC transporter permease [Deltaproteobacteria bacterium]|nr:ABC transporter permease [Deltaproteobacteria bacterium]
MTDRWTPVLGVAGALLVWEVGVRLLQIPTFILPSPSLTLEVLVRSLPRLQRHIGATLLEAVGGFLVGALIAVALSIAMVHWRLLERVLFPLLVIEQTMPKLAVAPLFIIWFGYGITPKIFIAILISFFPIIVSTSRGLLAVDPRMLALMHTLSASRWQVFAKIRFPNAIPHMFTGFRVAVPLSVIGAVVAEFVQADRGLGYMILVATRVRVPARGDGAAAFLPDPGPGAPALVVQARPGSPGVTVTVSSGCLPLLDVDWTARRLRSWRWRPQLLRRKAEEIEFPETQSERRA